MPIRTFAAINAATRVVTAQREAVGKKLNLLQDAEEIALIATIFAREVEKDEREQAEERASKNVVPIWSKS